MKYAFTLRKNKDRSNNTREQYHEFLNRGLYTHKKYHPEVILKFETKAGLHCHGLCSIEGVKNKHMFYKMLKPQSGWHLKVEEVYDYEGWINYITKEERPTWSMLSNEIEHKELGETYKKLKKVNLIKKYKEKMKMV